MDKELKDVLAAIETTKGLKDKIHKELGLTKKKGHWKHPEICMNSTIKSGTLKA